jgi:hypothetical protein
MLTLKSEPAANERRVVKIITVNLSRPEKMAVMQKITVNHKIIFLESFISKNDIAEYKYLFFKILSGFESALKKGTTLPRLINSAKDAKIVSARRKIN